MDNFDSIKLLDYEKWKQANVGKFSLYDYLHGVLSTQPQSPDLTFAYLKLLWPDFYSYNDQVFLKEEFEEQKYKGLVKQGYSGPELEYWMNLLNIDGLLNNMTTEQARYIGKSVASIWDKKLAIDFPSQRFNTECIIEGEDDEVYVVFRHQE